MNVTYHDDNSIDFAATGGLVSVAFVKGGDNANKYAYSPAVASDTNLVSPLNGGGQVPAVSHTVFCVVKAAPPPSGRDVPPGDDVPPSVPPSEVPPSVPASVPASVPPSDTPSGSVLAETGAPSGGVEAETNVPTAPSTDIGDNSSGPGNSMPVLLIVLGIIGLAAVVLTPKRARR